MRDRWSSLMVLLVVGKLAARRFSRGRVSRGARSHAFACAVRAADAKVEAKAGISMATAAAAQTMHPAGSSQILISAILASVSIAPLLQSYVSDVN